MPGDRPEKEVQMVKFQRKLAFLAVPAVLAVGAASYGSVVAFSSPSPTPAAAKATEAAEPSEPALPGGGYADKDSVQADTQQEGVN